MTQEQIHVQSNIFRSAVYFQHAEAQELSKAENTPTGINQKGTLSVDRMSTLVSYAGAFELEYSVNAVYT